MTPNWVMFLLYKSSSSPVGGERTGRPRSLLSTAVGGRSPREAFPHPADARSVDSRPSGDDDRSRESCSPERSTRGQREVNARSRSTLDQGSYKKLETKFKSVSTEDSAPFQVQTTLLHTKTDFEFSTVLTTFIF